MWNTGLEASPKGTELGASASYVIRLIKREFETLLSLEHSWDDEASPEMTHLAGSVCGLSKGIPTPLNVSGGLWWDYTNKELFRDAGGGFGIGTPIVSFDHSTLDNLISALAHSNYTLVDGDTIQDITVPTLEGLSQVIGDYSDSKYILSQGVHGNGVVHDAGVISDETFPGFQLGADKLNTAENTIFNGTLTGGFFPPKTGNLSMGRYAFSPYLRPGTSPAIGILFCPMLNIAPPENYIAGLRLQNTAFADRTLVMANRRLL